MKSGTKIAVITGSAGGLGKEFAEKLLASGQQNYHKDNQKSSMYVGIYSTNEHSIKLQNAVVE